MPEELINETPEFKCLQSRYTALVNESVHLRHQLAEARELVKGTKTMYDHHFEKIEVNFNRWKVNHSLVVRLFLARRI